MQSDPEAAKREPKIAEHGSSLYTPAELTVSGKKELEGYQLNRTSGPNHACVFLDPATLLCTIHETRPLVCRLFNCDGEYRARLIELGIFPPCEVRNAAEQIVCPRHSNSWRSRAIIPWSA